VDYKLKLRRPSRGAAPVLSITLPKETMDTFLRERSEFPPGEFPDQVDAFVQALSWFSRPAEFQHLRYEAMVIYDLRDEQQSYEDWKWERDTLEPPW